MQSRETFMHKHMGARRTTHQVSSMAPKQWHIGTYEVWITMICTVCQLVGMANHVYFSAEYATVFIALFFCFSLNTTNKLILLLIIYLFIWLNRVIENGFTSSMLTRRQCRFQCLAKGNFDSRQVLPGFKPPILQPPYNPLYQMSRPQPPLHESSCSLSCNRWLLVLETDKNEGDILQNATFFWSKKYSNLRNCRGHCKNMPCHVKIKAMSYRLHITELWIWFPLRLLWEHIAAYFIT